MVVVPGNAMTQPRQIIPGKTVLITRRTLRRYFLLRPDRKTNDIFKYLIAVMANKFGMVCHALCVMSSHSHIVLTDTRGELPNSLCELDRLLAFSMKVHRKWEGLLRDHESTSAVHLQTPESIIEKIAYLIANPTEVGAVYHAKDWPGLNTTISDLGKAKWEAKRPDVYFDQTNEEWPDTARV